ncbi:DMT family transporter [Lentibacter algarum]|uniref:DMT family transporter n=1 Tax=Lentibacter algarum TaxID=576131 RepID=UPI001C097305|nr:DMT family transporter [Lentibacter algarum]MBU2983059.1 DMT family transporter [Lentibacter algarum]
MRFGKTGNDIWGQAEVSDTKPVAAALWILAAMMILGVIDNFVAVIAQKISIWQLYFVRVCISIPVIFAMAQLAGARFLPQRWGAVLMRSTFFASAMLFYFSSLAFLPIAQSLAGLFTSPIIVVAVTALVLKEPIGIYRIGAVLVGFVGTLIVLQVSPSAFSPLVIVPVIGGFLYAMSAIITRRMCDGESTYTLLAGTMGMQGVLGIVGLLVIAALGIEEQQGPLAFVTRGFVWPMGEMGWLVVGHVLGSIAGVFCLTKGYQLGEASYVAVFEYSVMIFGPLFAWYWFGQNLSFGQIIGVGLIIAAGSVIALRSRAQ